MATDQQHGTVAHDLRRVICMNPGAEPELDTEVYGDHHQVVDLHRIVRQSPAARRISW